MNEYLRIQLLTKKSSSRLVSILFISVYAEYALIDMIYSRVSKTTCFRVATEYFYLYKNGVFVLVKCKLIGMYRW